VSSRPRRRDARQRRGLHRPRWGSRWRAWTSTSRRSTRRTSPA
jgi:hypothetical protein